MAQDQATARTIPYSGQLKDASVSAALDGEYELSFGLYDQPEGGNLLWSETQTGVAVSQGKFTTSLGIVNAIPEQFFTRREAWLEVGVRGPGEKEFTILAPRQSLAPDTPQGVDALACPHSHFTDNWVNNNINYGLRVENTGTGDGIRGISYSNALDYAGLVGVNYAGGSGIYALGYITGKGIYAESIANDAIEAVSHAPLASNKSAVYAHSVDGNGVWATSTNRLGVYAYSTNTNGLEAATGAAYANNKSAVYAHSVDGNGVWAESTNRYGVHASSAGNFAIEAVGNDSNLTDSFGDIVLGGINGEIFTFGDMLDLYTNGSMYIDLDNDNNTSFSFFEILGGDNSMLLSVSESSLVMSAGPQATFVKTPQDGEHLLYSIQSPEIWFEDFGSAVLSKGVTTVQFDPVFLQTVNTSVDYQVFLTPVCSEAVILYVAAKDGAGFTVKGNTMSNEPSACAFDYRIVAKRLGYENNRLEAVDSAVTGKKE